MNSDVLKRTLQERADEHPPPWVDIDSVIAAGDRRIRRRRAGRVALVAATVAAVALLSGRTMLTAGGPPPDAATGPDQRRAQPVAGLPAFLVPSSGGAVLHGGRATIRTGIEHPATWARSGSAFVVFDTSGGVWRVDRTGADRVGRATVGGGFTPMSDPRGSAVMWTRSTGDTVLLEGYDAVAGRRLPERDLGPGAALVAVNGATAYWTESRGLYAAPVAGGHARPVVPATPGVGLDVRDVAGDTMLVVADSGLATAPLDAPGDTTPASEGGLLSPDGRWLASTSTWMSVLDTETGSDVTPQVPHQAVVEEWLGADRFEVAVPLPGGGSRLEICTVPDGACRPWGERPADAVPQGRYDGPTG